MTDTSDGKRDFFISFNKADRSWATWIAWVLEEAGYSVFFQDWDFRRNFVEHMDEAHRNSAWTIAVLSDNYFGSKFTLLEWSARVTQEPERLIPVRVGALAQAHILDAMLYADLAGCDEAEAEQRLLGHIKKWIDPTHRPKPETRPIFPGVTAREVPEKPLFPGLPNVWNLPLRPNYFTGREEMLEDLHRNLTTGLTWTAAIHGLGGVGKTWLAIEYAYKFKSDYQVVWWMRADDRATLAADYALLAHELNLHQKNEVEQEAVIAAVRHWLENHAGWLLIFDNAEENGEDVRKFLPRFDLGNIILTSRYPFWQGLAGVSFGLNVWSREESVEFLLQRTKGNRCTANKVAEVLGDLPLALEQAAAYVEQTASLLENYANLLEQGYGVELRREPRNFEKTVAVTWEVSFKSLEQEFPIGAAMLNLCAFLAPDAIPLDVIRNGAAHLPAALKSAAANPVEFDRAAVSSLLQYSLAYRKDDALWIHRLVQAVTRDRLKEDQRRLYTQHAISLLNESLPTSPYTKIKTLSSPRNETIDIGIAWAYDRLLTHVLAAASHAQRTSVSLDTAAKLLNIVGLYRRMRGNLVDAKKCHNEALTIAREIGDQEQESRAWGYLALVYWDQGDATQAIDAAERALAIARTSENRRGEAATLTKLGVAYRDLGDRTKAIECHTSALAIAREIGDRTQESRILDNLGLDYRDVRNLKASTVHYNRALEIARELEDRHGECRILDHLGVTHHDLGEPHEAIKYGKEALDIAVELTDRAAEIDICSNLGLAYRSLGKARCAIEYHKRCLSIARGFGGRRAEARALDNLGLDHELIGELDYAIKDFESAALILEQQGDLLGKAHVFLHQAQRLAEQGNTSHSIAYVKQAQELFRQVNDPPGEGHVNEVLGIAHHIAGANNRALKCFKRALRIKRNVCERVGEGYVLARQSAVESALGDSSMAIKHANQALNILRKIGDRRGEALALNHIGTAYRLLGNTKQAMEYHTDAMEIARGLGLCAEEGHALFGRALATDVGVCREKAIFDAKAALMIFEGLGTHQAASVRTQLEQWKHTP